MAIWVKRKSNGAAVLIEEWNFNPELHIREGDEVVEETTDEEATDTGEEGSAPETPRRRTRKRAE